MIVVTTPTGSIGRRLVDLLLAADTPLRVIVRDPSRLADPVRDRVEVVTGSHADPATVEKAFTGADAVFWLRPPAWTAADPHREYVDFARPAAAVFATGTVGRVVGVSALGRGTPLADTAGLTTSALALDDLITSTGVAYRALALPSFMDNLLRQLPVIVGQGVFFEPSDGDRPHPTVATRDIAAVAADLLRDDSWSGQEEVPLLGPEDLTLNDRARIMSEVLDRPVRYQQVSGEAFRSGLVARGASEGFARAMLDMMLAKEAGLDDGVPRSTAAPTPTTFRTWCADVLAPAARATA